MVHKNRFISDEVFTDDLAWRLLRHFAALKLLIDPNGHKKTPSFLTRFLLMIWRLLTLPPVRAVPSALPGLTTLFGMGRGEHRHYYHHEVFQILKKSSQ
jgi:hypothetical protein